MELTAINEKQTVKNVKKKLREYPRWREVARDSAEQRITANYTFEPRSKSYNRSNIVETLAVRRIDAMNELEAIEEAHRNIIDYLSPLLTIPTSTKLGYRSRIRLCKDKISRAG